MPGTVSVQCYNSPQVKRRLLNLLTGGSLLLCVAVVVLWVRSYSGADHFALRHGGKVWVIRSYHGECEYMFSRFAATRGGWSRTDERRDRRLILFDDWPDWHWHHSHLALLSATLVLPAWQFLIGIPRRGVRPKHVIICVSIQIACLMAGFAATRDRDQVGSGIFIGAVALAIALFCLRDVVRDACADARVPPPWRLFALRSWTRQRQGLCARCGYDLRASPDRCPECGAAARPA